MYGNKRNVANKNTSVPTWFQDAFLKYPETFRMAFRYNASYTQIPANFMMCNKKLVAWNTLERAYIYAVRVHNRTIEGRSVFVSSGTSNFDSDPIK